MMFLAVVGGITITLFIHTMLAFIFTINDGFADPGDRWIHGSLKLLAVYLAFVIVVAIFGTLAWLVKTLAGG